MSSKSSSQDVRNLSSGGSQQHRRGGGNPQGGSRSTRGNRQQKQPPPSDNLDKLLYLIANLVGSIVQVTVKNGTVYSGIFHTANTEDNLGVCLKMARKINADGLPDGQIIDTLVVMGKDVIGVTAANVDLLTTKENQGFKTDTAISNSCDLRERVLEKWEPSQEDTLESLNDQPQEPGNWDQFAVNEKLFGVTTDFEENIYTTIIDKSGPDFELKEAEASRVANEIQRSATSNTHMAEERGHAIDSSGQDEEDRYSSVLRRAPAKYSAPPQVKKPNSSRGPLQQTPNSGRAPEKDIITPSPHAPQKSGSIMEADPPKDIGSWAEDVAEAPPVKNAWSRERPFKANAPTALSSAKKTPTFSVEMTLSGGDRSSPQRHQSSIVNQTSSGTSSHNNSGKKPLEYAQVANRRNEKKAEQNNHQSQQHQHQHQNQQSQQTVPPLKEGKPSKAFNGILDRDLQRQQQVHDNKASIAPRTAAPDLPAEPVAKAFSKFVHKEKEQRKQERKKEIGTVISELKSFSATFKLNTPVPSDLQELFAKNKNNASFDSHAVEKPAPVQLKPSPKSYAIPTSPSNSSNFKFNAKAMEFRPNPNAIVFVPSIPELISEENAFFGPKVIDKKPLSINDAYSAGFLAHTQQNPTSVSTQWPSNINVSFRQILPHHMPPGGMMGMPPPPLMPYEEMFGNNDGGGYPPPMPYGYPVAPYGMTAHQGYGPPRPRGFPPQYPMMPYGPMMYQNQRPPLQYPHDGQSG